MVMEAVVRGTRMFPRVRLRISVSVIGDRLVLLHPPLKLISPGAG